MAIFGRPRRWSCASAVVPSADLARGSDGPPLGARSGLKGRRWLAAANGRMWHRPTLSGRLGRRMAPNAPGTAVCEPKRGRPDGASRTAVTGGRIHQNSTAIRQLRRWTGKYSRSRGATRGPAVAVETESRARLRGPALACWPGGPEGWGSAPGRAADTQTDRLGEKHLAVRLVISREEHPADV